jgi:hypothetical protein
MDAFSPLPAGEFGEGIDRESWLGGHPCIRWAPFVSDALTTVVAGQMSIGLMGF